MKAQSCRVFGLAIWALASLQAQSTLESPTIRALAQAVQDGNATAEDAFWRQLVQRGTPLVERTDEDAEYALVTFVWKGSSSTGRIVVSGQLGQLTGTRPGDNELTQLAKTGVWYR